jgi:hypothetical protein
VPEGGGTVRHLPEPHDRPPDLRLFGAELRERLPGFAGKIGSSLQADRRQLAQSLPDGRRQIPDSVHDRPRETSWLLNELPLTDEQ